MKPLPPTAAATLTCGGSTLALLLREIRAGFWAQMEVELRAAGHELNFSQYITLKELAKGDASATPFAPTSRQPAWASKSSVSRSASASGSKSSTGASGRWSGASGN